MNLWAESDNYELAGAPVEPATKPGTGGGTRFIAPARTIVPALRGWLLADYVAPYCRSLAATRIFRRCFLIDGSGETRNAAKGAGASQRGDQGRAEPRLGIFEG